MDFTPPAPSFDVDESGGRWFICVHVKGRLYWELAPNANAIPIVSSISPEKIMKTKLWPILRSASTKTIDEAHSRRDQGFAHTHLELCVDADTVASVDHDTRRGLVVTFELAQTSGIEYPRLQAPKDAETFYREQATYWHALSKFPSHRTLDKSYDHHAISRLRTALLWSCVDSAMDPGSNSLFSEEDSSSMMIRLDEIAAAASKKGASRSAHAMQVWYVAKLMRRISEHRIRMHYAQEDAQTLRDPTKTDLKLPDYSNPFTCAVWVTICTLLLGVPLGYLYRVVAIDRREMGSTIISTRWRRFIAAMCQEWGATNLICTVLISATVAVLAIPEINGVVQTTAILSILCSIASVCLGSFLLWVNQSLMDNDSLVTFADFARAKALRVFPRLLAFILSIPLAMMLYALMFFLVSIMAYSVDSGIAGVSRTFRRTTEWIAVGVAGLILVFALITGVTFTDRGMHFFRWRREMKGKIGEKWKAWKAPRRGATRGDAEDRGENGEDAMSERKDPGATTPQPDLEIGPSTYRQ